MEDEVEEDLEVEVDSDEDEDSVYEQEESSETESVTPDGQGNNNKKPTYSLRSRVPKVLSPARIAVNLQTVDMTSRNSRALSSASSYSMSRMSPSASTPPSGRVIPVTNTLTLAASSSSNSITIEAPYVGKSYKSFDELEESITKWHSHTYSGGNGLCIRKGEKANGSRYPWISCRDYELKRANCTFRIHFKPVEYGKVFVVRTVGPGS